MSEQSESSFEGLTLKAIISITDVTYHGPAVSLTGTSNVLEGLIKAELAKRKEVKKAPISTCSGIISQTSYENLASVSTQQIVTAREACITCNAEINNKVNKFFAELEAKKAKARKGRTQARVPLAFADELKAHMEQFNVGKCLKVRIQSRLFSHSPKPGYHEVKSGGFSLTKVLYTFYMDYEEDADLQESVDTIVKVFQNETLEVERKQTDGYINLVEKPRTDTSGAKRTPGTYTQVQVIPGNTIITIEDENEVVEANVTQLSKGLHGSELFKSVRLRQEAKASSAEENSTET